MSKNFEEEYRHMIEEDIPDLWDRIEAQLPKDTVVVAEENSNSSDQAYDKQMDKRLEQVSGTQSDQDKQPDTVFARQSYEQTATQTKEYQSKKNNKKKIFTRRRFVAWGSLAAAVFAIFIVMPILVRMGAEKGGNSAAPMNEMHSNSAGAADVAEEPQSDGGMYDMVWEPTEVANSIEQEYSSNGTGDGYASAPADSSNDTDYDGLEEMLASEDEPEDIIPGTQSGYPEGSIHSVESNSGGKETDMPEGGIFESVVDETLDYYQADVRILSAVLTDNGITLYEAEILDGTDENWDHDWRKGARLFLMFTDKYETENSSSGHSVIVGRSYTLSLYSSGKEIESYGIGVSQPGNSGSSVYLTGIYIISAVENK